MGGQISVIKKVNDKAYSYSGWTNSLSNVFQNLDFYENPNNKLLREYLHTSYKMKHIVPDSYGIVVIDYDSKTISTINGYSSYLEIYASSLLLESYDSDGEIKMQDFFDKGFICMNQTKTKKLSKYEYERESKIVELDEIKKFKSLINVVEWLEGKTILNGKFNMSKRNVIIEIDDNTSIYNQLFIHYKKLGWKYNNFSENAEGYIKLFNILQKDGFNFTKEEIKEWNDFVNDIDEENEDLFLNEIVIKKREENINSLN